MERLLQRLFGLIILPASLPGDPGELASDLVAEPLTTLRRVSPTTFWSLVRQLIHHEKLTIPDDPQLEMLLRAREKYRSSWTAATIVTADGVKLDACYKPPADSQIAPRYILFIGGNSQKYEAWLPYFDMYANESELGFLCFNFRGVSQSEGAVTCLADMLADVRAAFDFLVEQRGALPHHIVLHGFSIGGAIAAAFLGQPGAPRAAITSDRSFSSFCHAAFALVRGPDAALGQRRATEPAEEAEEGEAGGEPPAPEGSRPWLRGAMRGVIGFARASAAQIGVIWARSTGWELDAVAAWPLIEGRKIVVFNAADNIINYQAASLHAALERASRAAAEEATTSSGGFSAGLSGKESPSDSVPLAHDPAGSGRDLLAGVTVIESEIRYAQGWAMHDFPLTLDPEAWYAMIAAERSALGLPAQR